MDILSNAPAQYGALGLLIVAQAIVIAALWRQWIKERRDAKKELADERRARDDERKARDEERERHHTEVVEITTRQIESQAELNLLLKGLSDERNIEKFIREYSKKD